MTSSPGETSVDIAIVGAGCAGRSLAWHLLDHGFDGRLVLLDPRVRFEADRTWCLFDVQEHAFESLVSHRWSRWRVRGGPGRWVERSAHGLNYTMLPSERFYEATTRRLTEANVELRLGSRVHEITPEPKSVLVHTSQGPLRASTVFDSRPSPPPGKSVSLLQHFTGWFVRTAEPHFDPEVATLMDFAVPQEQGISFLYELPFDAHTALLEATWFDARSPTPERRATLHRRLLEERTQGLNYTVERVETGAIPMCSAATPPRTSERVYAIGLGGGMAKPSTGYAFGAIQRFSEEMAVRLSRCDLPEPPAPRAWKTRLQDASFLSYLERYPSRAPAAFERLFERVPPLVLARFLNDLGTPADDLRVMRTMPTVAMAREVLRSRNAWLRP